jgi:flagellar motility protein MotE (MotC chaperone)
MLVRAIKDRDYLSKRSVRLSIENYEYEFDIDDLSTQLESSLEENDRLERELNTCKETISKLEVSSKDGVDRCIELNHLLLEYQANEDYVIYSMMESIKQGCENKLLELRQLVSSEVEQYLEQKTKGAK